jgi:hypothetical protein
VLDPAGGSGNFLYVTLQKLLELEKEVNHFLREHGFTPQFPQVSPLQLHCLEIDPYAHDLAQTVVWIGYIQWLRANGYGFPAEPILKPMGANFRCADALFTDWPEVEFIVSNPPFLGGSKLWEELGREYQKELWRVYEGRVPGFADLCCYWFEKARGLIEHGKCKRAGLLATQAIRGGASREVLKSIKKSGDIFFAVSDREWVLDGANVHVSMVGFDDGEEAQRTLNGQPACTINANLTSTADVAGATPLKANLTICFMGPSPKAAFDVSEEIAREMLVTCGNVNALPNSDVIRRVQSGVDLTSADRRTWTVDFGMMTIEAASRYQTPFEYLKTNVYPIRSQNRRKSYAERWWQYAEARPGMRKALTAIRRFVVTPEVAKHRVFVWRAAEHLCNQQTLVFARDDDYFFGVLHSRFHEVWALMQGTQLREKESGFRYTPTTCFETFPLPRPTPAQESAIAAAAKELNELRERWLNPPEWTVEKILEFPGSVNGPWSRYIVPSTINPQLSTALVRYPRPDPRDANCAARLKKRTLTNLYNERPVWLDLAHKKLDAAVAAAYGWSADLSDEQILERLLALNLERAAEEQIASEVKKPKTSCESRAEEII